MIGKPWTGKTASPEYSLYSALLQGKCDVPQRKGQPSADGLGIALLKGPQPEKPFPRSASDLPAITKLRSAPEHTRLIRPALNGRICSVSTPSALSATAQTTRPFVWLILNSTPFAPLRRGFEPASCSTSQVRPYSFIRPKFSRLRPVYVPVPGYKDCRRVRMKPDKS